MSDEELLFENIHAGDVIFECNQYNGSIEIKVLTEPALDGTKWTFKALTPNGEQDYLIDPGSQHLLGSYFCARPKYEPVVRLAAAK